MYTSRDSGVGGLGITGIVILGLLAISGIGIASCVVSLIGGAVDNGVAVVKKEFYPDALLRKYEWFKDASAALDKKFADIQVYNTRLTELASQYKGVKRPEWARDDREQYSIWQSEVSGVKASYNQLASEYNAEMAKFNYRFTNVGDVPQGGKPLPREYRAYIEE